MMCLFVLLLLGVYDITVMFLMVHLCVCAQPCLWRETNHKFRNRLKNIDLCNMFQSNEETFPTRRILNQFKIGTAP